LSLLNPTTADHKNAGRMPDIKNVISRRSLLKGAPLAAAAAVSLDGLTPVKPRPSRQNCRRHCQNIKTRPKTGGSALPARISLRVPAIWRN
jgi:hypothetical protein